MTVVAPRQVLIGDIGELPRADGHKTLRRPDFVGNGKGGIILVFVDKPICVCSKPNVSWEGYCHNCGGAIPLQDGS
jgi:hypothetical protein